MGDMKLGGTGRKSVDLAQTLLVLAIVTVVAWVLFALVSDGADWIAGHVLN